MTFAIKNLSDEDYEVVTKIDPHVPGCRVANIPPEPMLLQPGQEQVHMGYEPGVSFVIRPVDNPHRHRSSL